jgi:ribosomal protein S18 acetylase RimI-like enzyme
MNPIEIIPYNDDHQPFFEAFNRSWIEKYFRIEEIDRYVLQHPREAIIENGGAILMAVYGGRIAGTVALRKLQEQVFELTKMAVEESFRRKGIAEALSRAAFEKVGELGGSKLVLYSHTSLLPALAMYRKLGFREVPIEKAVYKRSDIKMEIAPLPDN